MSSHFARNAVGLAVLSLVSCLAWAQSDSSATTGGAALPEVTVTGNPLGASELIAPTTSVSGEQLLLRAQPTLGETLNNLPGVSSTYFGPNASRPTIRGQDGDRIRILQNGGAAPDASARRTSHQCRCGSACRRRCPGGSGSWGRAPRNRSREFRAG